MPRLIGLMSGTSADGIDGVLIELDAGGALRMIATHQQTIPDALRARVLAVQAGAAATPDELCALDIELGEVFAQAAGVLLARHGSEVAAIGSHGQTVRHAPHGPFPFSAQLGNPSVIAERTGITTIADFRARDVAAGGQGAPLAPGFHDAVFRDDREDRLIINIGGIANLTWLARDHGPVGFDTGPGNGLMDAWAQRHCGTPLDAGGAWAASGTVDPALLERLLADPYFQRTAPKSTGKEYFNPAWLDHALAGAAVPPQDVQASLLELSVQSMAAAARTLASVQALYLCGGGVHNTALCQRLGDVLPWPVRTTAALGWDPDWVEAAAFAWLAHRHLAGLPGNVPGVTGARREVVLGGCYPA